MAYWVPTIRSPVDRTCPLPWTAMIQGAHRQVNKPLCHRFQGQKRVEDRHKEDIQQKEPIPSVRAWRSHRSWETNCRPKGWQGWRQHVSSSSPGMGAHAPRCVPGNDKRGKEKVYFRQPESTCPSNQYRRLETSRRDTWIPVFTLMRQLTHLLST